MPLGRSKRSNKPALRRRSTRRKPAAPRRVARRKAATPGGVVRPAQVPPKQGMAEPIDALPPRYGDTLLIAQPRDPHWLHAYWEAPEIAWATARRQLGAEGTPTLRVYELTGPSFTSQTIRRWCDVTLPPFTEDWHVEVQQPATWWCLELGLRGPGERFVPIVRSNLVETPADHPSDEVDEGWGLREGVFGRFQSVSSPGSPLWRR